MPPLSMQDIASLRQGLEEAIALTLRGQATGIVILAPRNRRIESADSDVNVLAGAKAWHAGPGAATAAGRCQLALLSKAPLDDEPPEPEAA